MNSGKQINNDEVPGKDSVQESQPVYGFVSKSPEEKLADLVFRSDIEKLQAFTKMLQRNATLKRGIVTYPAEKS
ncbi:hypothetical protein [Sediminibacterium sp.]|uniref:hypothetical protein n=1 Tax=Sediminibacterium sp. TaxID=1917865 RepID=UPI0025E74B5A|nr:hypothetical protein [Sediminibacterium sp.]MBW0178814.1 hypothetical protein [Sediminibacterium sp.]